MTSESPHRQFGDATLGSAPSVAPIVDASSATAFLDLDLTTYVADLGEDVPAERALEFLTIIASMMATCVRNGWDVGVCGQVLDAFNQASTQTLPGLESTVQPTTKAPSDLQHGGQSD